MTSIIRDIGDVFMFPTPKGMAFSKEADEQLVEVRLRVEVDAFDRDNWEISDVYMVEPDCTFHMNGVWRKGDICHRLEGAFKEQAIAFLNEVHGDFLQDAVAFEIIPSVEDTYTPMVT